jgi:hypothetical protein
LAPEKRGEEKKRRSKKEKDVAGTDLEGRKR